jgi:hypothetical protein
MACLDSTIVTVAFLLERAFPGPTRGRLLGRQRLQGRPGGAARPGRQVADVVGRRGSPLRPGGTPDVRARPRESARSHRRRRRRTRRPRRDRVRGSPFLLCGAPPTRSGEPGRGRHGSKRRGGRARSRPTSTMRTPVLHGHHGWLFGALASSSTARAGHAAQLGALVLRWVVSRSVPRGQYVAYALNRRGLVPITGGT